MDCDLLIVGGGASGLIAAITAKRFNSELKVILAERTDRVGKKLAITGNGRCNITNKNLSVLNYHGQSPTFAGQALNRFTPADTAKFFRSIGVIVQFENDGKAYPYSLQASSVVDALRFACEELGVVTITNTFIKNIEKIKTGYRAVAETELFAKSAILATGGCAGGERLGTDGSGYSLFEKLGHRIVTPLPTIVQVKTENAITRQLKGIKVVAGVTVLDNNSVLGKDNGEVLFSEYGLSGPPILQLSHSISKQPNGLVVSLDLMPDYDESSLTNMLNDRVILLPNRTLSEFFTGMLHKRVGQTMIKCCGLSLSDLTGSLTEKDIEKLCNTLKNFCFKATGTTGFLNAQATSGGVSTEQFSSMALESKKTNGLFACGEVLDIDGDCGGFNLQWAWSSGVLAAESAVSYLMRT